MLLRIFKSIQPSIIFLIILMTIGIWLNAFLNPGNSNFYFNEHPMPLYGVLTNLVSPVSFLGKLITMIIWVIHGLLLVRLNTKFFFINERTYLPAAVFILSACFIADLQSLNPVIISSIFLLITIERLIDSYRNTNISFNSFDAGLLIGTGTLFYLNLGFFLLLIWIGLLILRPVNWREWVVPILGFCTPVILAAAIYYLLNGDLFLFIGIIRDNLVPFKYDITQFHYYFLGYLALLVAFASFQILRDIITKKIKSRKIFLIFWWVFSISAIVFFIVPWVSFEMIVFAFVPLSFLLTNYYLNIRVKWFGELTFLLFAGGLIFILFADKII